MLGVLRCPASVIGLIGAPCFGDPQDPEAPVGASLGAYRGPLAPTGGLLGLVT